MFPVSRPRRLGLPTVRRATVQRQKRLTTMTFVNNYWSGGAVETYLDVLLDSCGRRGDCLSVYIFQLGGPRKLCELVIRPRHCRAAGSDRVKYFHPLQFGRKRTLSSFFLRPKLAEQIQIFPAGCIPAAFLSCGLGRNALPGLHPCGP
jgi:hypothetical protein